MPVEGLSQVTQSWTREMPVVLATERDAEVLPLLEYVEDKKPQTLLDVGCFYTNVTYAPKIRELVPKYDGIDINLDVATKPYLNNYFMGNAITYPLDPHEMVICLSSIEHAGITTYQANPREERRKLFTRCLELAQKWLWISFPVGLPFTYPGQLEVIGREELEEYEEMCKPYSLRERFFYTQGAPAKHPWYEHEMRDLALSIPYIEYVGNQSTCVMEVEK